MRVRRGRDRDGMILLNVLVIVAIAAATVAVMIASGDIQLQRTIRLHDASQAQAYARAGELSAITALRRDGLTAPGSDFIGEPWSAIGQTAIAIPGGRFALSIADEQARFNVNALTTGDAIAVSRFARVARSAGLSEETVTQIATVVDALGPLRDEGVLTTAGVAPGDLARLRPLIVFLPPDAELNLNTVDGALLGALVDDPRLLRPLLEQRARNGLLTEADVAAAGLTGLGGYTSNHFLLTTVVRVGDVTQTTRSRLTRTLDLAAPAAGGSPVGGAQVVGSQVAVTARRRTAD